MDPALLRRAFEFALAAHGEQVRKGLRVPFVAHLMGVCALVMEHGGDAETSAAALLHDTLEDTDTTADDLANAFGARVAAIVVACTDNLRPCPPVWRERKERFILCIHETDADSRLVIAADKLHNARDVVRSQRALGDAAFRPFQGGKEGTVWYYGASLAALQGSRDDRPGFRALLDDLSREVREMERLAGVRESGTRSV